MIAADAPRQRITVVTERGVRRVALSLLLTESWRTRAPKRLVAAFDEDD